MLSRSPLLLLTPRATPPVPSHLEISMESSARTNVKAVRPGCWEWSCEGGRKRNVGRLLLSSIEHLAADWGHEQVWVATGDDAVGFYRQCGWQDAERLRLVSTGTLTTILTKEV